MRYPLVQRGLIALVLVLAMTVWFSASAVVPALASQWQLSAGAAAWMTAPVQAGFVLGAVGSAALGLADRIRPHLLAAAQASRFGEIVVQGGITTAILNAVVAECLPGPGTVFLNVNWDFKAPVRPGDVITGRVEIIEARADKPVTKLRTTVIRGDGTVALDGTAVCYTMTLDS